MSRSAPIVLGSIVLALAALLSHRRPPSPGVVGGLGELRSFLSAERAYAASNGGYFDHPSCLGAPSRCIPGYPATSPVFLDPAMSRLQPTLGYPRLRRPASPASPWLRVPFPAVASVRADGAMAEVEDGRCPDSCETSWSER